MLNEAELFIAADQRLAEVLDQVQPDQWEKDLPDWFRTGMSDTNPTMTLREVVNYHAYDDAWMPDMLAGHTMAEAGVDTYDGDLLGDDPAASYRKLCDAACAAARDFDDFDRTVHFSYGDYAARDALPHVTLFRTARARDFARLIGIDTSLPAPLVEGMYSIVSANAEEWRAMGVIGPKRDVADDASIEERFVALLGVDA